MVSFTLRTNWLSLFSILKLVFNSPQTIGYICELETFVSVDMYAVTLVKSLSTLTRSEMTSHSWSFSNKWVSPFFVNLSSNKFFKQNIGFKGFPRGRGIFRKIFFLRKQVTGICVKRFLKFYRYSLSLMCYQTISRIKILLCPTI